MLYLCQVTLCYVMLCYVMLCYVMLCYVMLCYVMLCYVMFCFDFFVKLLSIIYHVPSIIYLTDITSPFSHSPTYLLPSGKYNVPFP